MTHTSCWTDSVWRQSRKIFSGIVAHPFITQLSAGLLPQEAFSRYLVQDELYLGQYGRQMFLLAGLIGKGPDQDLFLEFAREGLEGERLMHERLISRFHVEARALPSEVTVAYNAHSQRALDSQDVALGLSAMLPCMWVYNEVGLHILRSATLEDNPCREWILEYGNPAFTQGVESVRRLADRLALDRDEPVRASMSRLFLEAMLFEYASWDYGYRGCGQDYSYMYSLKEWL